MMNLRIVRHSFLKPISSPGRCVAVVSVCLAAWFVSLVSVMVLSDTHQAATYYIRRVFDTALSLLYGLGIVAAATLIEDEARSGRLMLELLVPVERWKYYLSQLVGRGVFCVLYALSVAYGLYAILLIYVRLAFPVAEYPFPPALLTSTTLKCVGLMNVTFSLGMLACISSMRFGHVAYWLALWFASEQAWELRSAPEAPILSQPVVFVCTEVIRPALLGPAPTLITDAVLGPWYLVEAVSQAVFGLLVAFTLGVLAFYNMEVGLQR